MALPTQTWACWLLNSRSLSSNQVEDAVFVLGGGTVGKTLTWDSRGWESKDEFTKAFERTTEAEGRGLIARAQTQQEAEKLVECLHTAGFQAECSDAPKLSENKAGCVKYPSDLTIAVPVGGPKEWAVAAGPVDGGSADQVKEWRRNNQDALRRAFAQPDGAAGQGKQNFGWNDRGFLCDDHWAATFDAIAEQCEIVHGQIVVAHHMTQRDAEVLAARIDRIAGSKACVWGKANVPEKQAAMLSASDHFLQGFDNSGQLRDHVVRALMQATGIDSQLDELRAAIGAVGGGSRGNGNRTRGRRDGHTVKIRYRRRRDVSTSAAAVDEEVQFERASVQTNDPESGTAAWLSKVRMQLAQQEGWPLAETIVELDSDGLEACLGLPLDHEDAVQVVRWSTYHNVEQRSHPLNDNARRQLMGNANLWDVAVVAVASNPGHLRKHWKKMQRTVFQKLQSAGWDVVDAITRIRNGERELQPLFTMSSGRALDESERGVVEHVLCMVKELERVDAATGKRKRTFPLPENVKGLLRKPFVTTVVNSIVSGNWDEASDELDEQEDHGWELTTPCEMMRAGSRDLIEMTQTVDPASASVVEGILEKVLELEGPDGPWLCRVCAFRCEHDVCEMCGAARPLPMRLDAALGEASSTAREGLQEAGEAAAEEEGGGFHGAGMTAPMRTMDTPAASFEPVDTPTTLSPTELNRSESETRRENVRLKRELETKEGSSICVVCMEKPKGTLLLPCKHMCCCSGCSKLISNKCPVCRTPVQSKIDVYT